MNLIENKNYNPKNYLLALGLALLFFFLGASLLIYFIYIPFKLKANLSFSELYDLILMFQSIDSKEAIRINGSYIIPSEYFATFPDKLKIVSIFYCLLQFFMYIPILIFVLIYLRKDFISDFINFKNNFGKMIVLPFIGFGIMIGCTFVISFIYTALGIEGTSANEESVNFLLSCDGNVLMYIAVILIGPICEEIIFRKLLIDSLEKIKLKPVWACLISAFIFAFIHVMEDLDSYIFIFQYLALAIPMVYIYHKSGNNIFVSTILHIFNNAFACLSMLFIWNI